jgi:TldD protein
MPQLTRRGFVKTGAMGLALASIPGFFRGDPAAALTPSMMGKGSLQSYLDHFGVTEELLREIMSVALSRGGEYCDLYFQHSISTSIGLEDNIVNRAYTNVDMGVGIRVLKGDQTGYSFTEELTVKAMKNAALTAANIADSGASPAPARLNFHPGGDYYPLRERMEDVGIDLKIPKLQRVNDRMLAADSRVLKARIFYNDSSSYFLMVNSEGRIVCDHQPMTTFHAGCTAEKDGQREQANRSLNFRKGIELLDDDRLDQVADEAVERTLMLFDAGKPKAGEMEVVLAAGSSGILLHEAIGHGMEADFNRKDESIFSDKIGKPVAENFVTIVDDGTNPHFPGSINIDDEGNDSQKTYLVEDGILRSYMHDRISAKHYGVKPTGSGRRQSFRHQPMPRMRNTYMLPGPHTRDDVIGSVKKGVYCDVFANGEVHIGPGDFTFYVKIGRLIENGKLTSVVKDINLIGNGPEVLSRITMVGDDLDHSTGAWTCGKNGQGVPVSMGLPTVKVSSITVGGENS